MVKKNEWDDNKFKLFNIVVDVAFMFGMSKYDCVYKLFKFVFVACPDELGVLIPVEL